MQILALVAPLWGGMAWGQYIKAINFPTFLCAGVETVFTFGFQEGDNIEMGHKSIVLSHAERIFLPDGESCGTMGCAYESPLEFTQFSDEDSVRSVEDIKYLRLNIEHSFIGDLYIAITCPTGQSADVLKFGGSPTSSCASSIGTSHRGWVDGSNSTSTYFGDALDGEAYSSYCDSSASGNEPGTGWNYCWSSSTTHGYTYAGGDGYVYRTVNHSSLSGGSWGMAVDSSNVSAGTQFYHPDQNFASLIGCPLNGDWSILVMDGWGGDNGYIFGWELSLATDYDGDTCNIVSRSIEGPYLTRVSDSVYTVNVPASLTRDTTVIYRVWTYNTCGDTIDTLFNVTLRPSYGWDRDTTVCDMLRFYNHNYYETQVVDHNYYSEWGCDSVLHLHLTVNHRDTARTYLRRCDPMEWHGQLCDTTGRYYFDTTTVHGCDSVCVLNLTVWGTSEGWVRDSVCDSELPYRYADSLFLRGTVSGVYDFHFRDLYGCDSLMHLDLTVSHTPTLELELRDYNCHAETFKVAALYDMGAVTWTSSPLDPSLEGQEHQPVIAITPTLPTTYTALVVNPGTRCSTERSITVSPIPLINACMNLNPDFATRSRTQVTLQDCSSGNVNQWLWLADGEVVGSSPQVIYNYPITRDSLEVMLVVGNTSSLCRDTAYGTLYLIGGDLWMPNAFTPGRDVNSRFLAKGNGLIDFEMSIYNRNGQRIYYSVDMDEGWDGTGLDGRDCPAGSYTYRVRYTLQEAPSNPVTQTGNLLLIR